ncbi:MAG: T9SS type A sorting domain-containing protein [Saprospiraceae bacterium]|nr:T9SS type A sorting domain-containing protein [Saprospiraceae bacterium]
MKNLFAIFFVFSGFFPQLLLSNHQIGSYINYKITPELPGHFLVEGTLTVLRDPNTINGAGFDSSIELGIYQNNGSHWQVLTTQFLGLRQIKEVSLIDITQLCREKNQLTNIEMAYYDIKLRLPKINGDYLIAHQRCCRVENIFNIEDPGLGGILYHIMISAKGQTQTHSGPQIDLSNFQNAIIGENTSFKVLNPSIPIGILGVEDFQPFSVGGLGGSSHGLPGSKTQDCDGVQPDPGNCLPPFSNVNYRSGFSKEKPLGDFGKLELNLSTGNVNIQSQIIGNFLSGFLLTVSNLQNELLSAASMEFIASVINENSPIYPIRGNRFFDENKNGLLDISEKIYNFPIEIIGKYCNHQAIKNGKFEINAIPKEEINIFSASPIWNISYLGENFVKLSSDSIRPLVEQDIPFIANDAISSLNLTGNFTNRRCNESSEYILILQNSGTTSLSGMISVSIDSKLKFIEVDHPYQFVNGRYLFEINNLEALSDDLKIHFKFIFPDESHVGKELQILAEFASLHYKTTYEDKTIVRCAYDPNQKSSVPFNGFDNRIRKNQTIVYTIDFENLGNDTAKDVLIKDMIDFSLKLNSFELLESSHPCTHHIAADRTLSFLFKNINLPYSKQNPEAAKGFVRFKMDPVDHLKENDVIVNYANIYFDKNRPIITNSVFNTIYVDPGKGTKSKKIIEEYLKHTKLYPQPFSEEFHFEIPYYYWLDGECNWSLFNSFGKLIRVGRFSAPINILNTSDLSDGVYFLLFDYNGQLNQTKKLVKISQ